MIRLPFVKPDDVAEAIRAARALVAAGGVVLLPTESFYALGANPSNAAGVARVVAMKERPPTLGLPVLCADWRQLESLVVVPDTFRVRLRRLWPAPLTAVLPTVAELPAGRGGTLAVRIPAHPELRALLYGVGPLTATSANRHGDPPFVTVDGALGSLALAPALALDGGETAGGAVSTLVDLSRETPEVLREGACGWDEPYPVFG